ncbi:MAG: hypothetical protein QOD69_1323 [Solirubrobacteraceae bacterium]|nr:hypothetical protein [Solirubrobacteraceae bacterium]
MSQIKYRAYPFLLTAVTVFATVGAYWRGT